MAISYTRGFSVDDMVAKFKTMKNDMDQSVDKVAHASAEAVMELSKAYAPVDEGHIEEAHHIIVKSSRMGNPVYDVSFYDEEVALYYVALHQGIMPYPNGHEYNLGPLSEKKAEETGMPVGPFFLTRAFAKLKPTILKDYRDAVKGVIK